MWSAECPCSFLGGFFLYCLFILLSLRKPYKWLRGCSLTFARYRLCSTFSPLLMCPSNVLGRWPKYRSLCSKLTPCQWHIPYATVTRQAKAVMRLCIVDWSQSAHLCHISAGQHNHNVLYGALVRLQESKVQTALRIRCCFHSTSMRISVSRLSYSG